MKAYAKTDIGSKRSMNQDYMYCNTEPVGSFQNLLIVADGMGGHRAGDYASRLCVETMVQSLEKSAHKTPVSLFEEAVTAANKAVFEESASHVEYEGMGTTVVACTLEENTLYIANIGDSRLYLIRDGIEQITDDHSLVEKWSNRVILRRVRQGYIRRKILLRGPLASMKKSRLTSLRLMWSKGMLLCSAVMACPI